MTDNLTPADRENLATALQHQADAGLLITHLCLGRDWPDGSPGDAVVKSPLALRGDWLDPTSTDRNAGHAVHLGLLSAAMSTHNLFGAAAAVLRGPGDVATGFSTLVRSSLETLSRIWWVLSTNDPDEVIRRHLVLARQELGRLVALNVTDFLVQADGKKVDPAQLRSNIETWLQAAGLDWRDQLGGETNRTCAFVAAFYTNAPTNYAELLYYLLSADSHGLGVGINTDLHLDGSVANPFERVTLRTSRSVVRDRVNTLLSLHGAVHDMLADFCALPAAVRQEWNENKIRAYQPLRQVPHK